MVQEMEARTPKRLPVKFERIDLDGEWEGWSFEARTSMTLERFSELTEWMAEDDPTKQGQIARDMIAYLRSIVRWWDFVDEAGDPLVLEEDESWKQIPVSLFGAMVQAVMQRIAQAPLVNSAPSPSSPSTETTTEDIPSA